MSDLDDRFYFDFYHYVCLNNPLSMLNVNSLEFVLLTILIWLDHWFHISIFSRIFHLGPFVLSIVNIVWTVTECLPLAVTVMTRACWDSAAAACGLVLVTLVIWSWPVRAPWLASRGWRPGGPSPRMAPSTTLSTSTHSTPLPDTSHLRHTEENFIFHQGQDHKMTTQTQNCDPQILFNNEPNRDKQENPK